MAAKQWCPD